MNFNTAGARLLLAAVLVSVVAVPSSAEWNKGVEAYKAKDFATAVKEFEEVTKTNPLSKTRAEDIAFLRQWAKERTVAAE